jgi:RimJ/RimL family protein N-acetyltransferase
MDDGIIIRTERLNLRTFCVEDAALLYKLNADKEVMKYTGDKAFESVEAAEKFIQSYTDYERNNMGRWQIFTKEEKEYLGWCGLKKHSCGMIDLGYRLLRTSWGKGYATEAAQACLAYGFRELDIKTIVGRVAKDNIPSIRVLEKVGMTFWKSDKCEGITDAKYYRIVNPNN